MDEVSAAFDLLWGANPLSSRVFVEEMSAACYMSRSRPVSVGPLSTISPGLGLARIGTTHASDRGI
jgi:hypothetical protein